VRVDPPALGDDLQLLRRPDARRFVFPDRSNGPFGLGYQALDDVGGGLFPGHEPDSLPGPMRERLNVAAMAAVGG
jgi:hypothetical protein